MAITNKNSKCEAPSFASERAARRAAAKLIPKLQANQFSVSKCPHCSFWHITGIPGAAISTPEDATTQKIDHRQD